MLELAGIDDVVGVGLRGVFALENAELSPGNLRSKLK
jgi:hypothetical protein